MRPFVIIFSTISIDGRLAAKNGFSELSCPYDKTRQHILRSEVDAVLVGANTVRIDNPSLSLKYARGRPPLRVVVSTKLQLNSESKIFIGGRTVAYAISPNEEIKNKLLQLGVQVRKFGGKLCEVMRDLYESFSVEKVMVEGGGGIIWSLVKESCFDELRLTVARRSSARGRL
ncbi:diaminohydroxyphosphoribosylaminopyrimidine reductase [Sulfodiicoccus acidiphilus]|uniref:Diaminohydroxyphosphoribosylaminopyrimidine reductase n=1 Tax=Sulfodiicoccus acidiphilus TaxID=1670455 RepID=A0A348B0D0_9CREN|nr:diaminohydroxyphosphoribosylaminopyrimidine reductase [Sulfodiicoccus acidiphilus]